MLTIHRNHFLLLLALFLPSALEAGDPSALRSTESISIGSASSGQGRREEEEIGKAKIRARKGPITLQQCKELLRDVGALPGTKFNKGSSSRLATHRDGDAVIGKRDEGEGRNGGVKTAFPNSTIDQESSSKHRKEGSGNCAESPSKQECRDLLRRAKGMQFPFAPSSLRKHWAAMTEVRYREGESQSEIRLKQ